MGNKLACCVNPPSICVLVRSRSLDDVSVALRELLGDESVTLIFGIGFGRNPGWRAWQNKNLHEIGNEPNSYEKVITIVGRTVNNINHKHRPIYVFGFGDAMTTNKNVFKFLTEPCDGYEEAIRQYKRLAHHARPTESVSYGPIIRKATRMASENLDKHHVLVIVAGEPVTRSCFTEHGQLSTDEADTYNAIEAARNYRLSIVLVGVGETNGKMKKGLWISRCCNPNNFKFVDYTKISSGTPVNGRDQETEFCVAVTEHLPGQIKLCSSLRSNDLAAVVPESEDLLP